MGETRAEKGGYGEYSRRPAKFAAATTKAAREIVKEAKEWMLHGKFSIDIITTTSDTSAVWSSFSVYISAQAASYSEIKVLITFISLLYWLTCKSK